MRIKRFPTAEIIVWALNIVSLFFVVRYLFRMNSIALFYGWDPQGIRTYFGTRYRLSDAQFGFGSDFINGLGNIAAGYPNPWSYPSVLLSWNASGEIPDPSLTFAIAATELFVATI